LPVGEATQDPSREPLGYEKDILDDWVRLNLEKLNGE
jgi:hypothetical protein